MTLAETLEGVTGDVLDEMEAWLRHLEAERKSDKTRQTYRESVSQLAGFLQSTAMPTDVAAIHREHVESFIIDLASRWKSATANNRFRGLQQFFRWLAEEHIIKTSPMENMKPPKVEEVPPDVLRDDQIIAILEACERDKAREGRRDAAIIRVFLDTGARRSELVNIGVEDVDLTRGTVWVTGKASASRGPRTRQLSIGARTVRALDRYLRLRKTHPQAVLPVLWLGHKGKMTPSGIEQIIRRRGREAGIDVHPHQLRHTYAHLHLLNGGSENALMALAGWESRTMLGRYAKSAASERALAEHKRLALGDRY